MGVVHFLFRVGDPGPANQMVVGGYQLFSPAIQHDHAQEACKIWIMGMTSTDRPDFTAARRSLVETDKDSSK